MHSSRVSMDILLDFLLPKGQTPNSVFKIPIEGLYQHSTCSVVGLSGRAELLRRVKFIVWDEVGSPVWVWSCGSIDETPEVKPGTLIRRVYYSHIRRSSTNITCSTKSFSPTNYQRVFDQIEGVETFQENHIDTKHESVVDSVCWGSCGPAKPLWLSNQDGRWEIENWCHRSHSSTQTVLTSSQRLHRVVEMGLWGQTRIFTRSRNCWVHEESSTTCGILQW